MRMIEIPDKCFGCDYQHWCRKFGKSLNSRKRCNYIDDDDENR